MIPKARVLAAAGISVVLLWPTTALAQRARAVPAVRGHLAIRGGFYSPYYYRPFVYPYFYSPFFFGFGAYYDSWWGWNPYYAAYPYAYPYGAWASARLEVKPKDAQVYLDGYYVGLVRQFDGIFKRLDVPLGEHDLAIYMPGYHTLRERMLFRPGQTYHFKETMQPLALGEPPEAKPQPDPNAARQNAPRPYPNGRYPGVPYPNAPYPNAPYPNAPYPNAPYPNAPYPNAPYPTAPPPPPPDAPRMEPPPGAPPTRGGDFGTLNLRVQPEDAIVTIDGQRWDSPQGGSRLTVQLAPGSHRIEVTKDGFRPYSSTVEIRPGQPQNLNISLPPGD